MDWHDELKMIGETARDEFGYQVLHTPTITRPNYPCGPDPDRPPYQLCAMFEEDYEIAGGTKSSARDGLRETNITTSEACVIARLADFRHKPTQGDLIEIFRLGRVFTVTDIRRDMEGMTKLVLEDQSRIPGG